MGDLCSLADVREYLGISDPAISGADPILTRLVSASSAFIQAQVGQDFASQAYADQVHSGDGTAWLRLRYRPVVSIEALTIDGNTVAARTATTEGYVLQGDWLVLSGAAGAGGTASGAYGSASPTRWTTLRFTPGNANVIVSYTAGYAAIPEDVRQAAIELTALRYKEKERPGIVAQGGAGGETLSYLRASFPPSVQDVIDRYIPKSVG